MFVMSLNFPNSSRFRCLFSFHVFLLITMKLTFGLAESAMGFEKTRRLSGTVTDYQEMALYTGARLRCEAKFLLGGGLVEGPLQ